MSNPQSSIPNFGPRDLPLVSAENRKRANDVIDAVNSKTH